MKFIIKLILITYYICFANTISAQGEFSEKNNNELEDSLNYEIVKDKLKDYIDSKYNFRSWDKILNSEYDIFKKCNENVCQKIKIDDGGESIGLTISKIITNGKNENKSNLLFVIIKNPDNNKPIFALEISQFKNGKKVFGDGIAAQYKLQCDNSKTYSDKARYRITKNKGEIFDEHYIEFYNVCRKEPFYSLLIDN